MKTILMTVMCVITFSIIAGQNEVEKQFYNQTQRRIEIDNRRQLKLANNGKVMCEIVVSDNAAKTVKFAAKELQGLLEKVVKGKIAIVNEPNKGIASIILGDDKLSRQLGLDVNKLPRDGYYIKSDGNCIFIVGRDDPKVDPERSVKGNCWRNHYERATLFGVYDFLERFCGVKLLFPGEIGTITPYKPNLSIPAMDILERPDFTIRYAQFKGEWYGDENVKDGRYLNQYRLRLQTDYIPNCHGLGRMGYMERFAEKYPDYFAKMPSGQRYSNPNMHHPGQLCFNSEITEEIYKDAKAYLTGNSAKERGVFHARWNRYCWDLNACKPGFFNVMPQDSYYKCQCEKCQNELKSYKNGYNDIIWKRTVEWAKRLKKDSIPGMLTQMAYAQHKKIPEFDIPDNVMVMVAIQGPWSERLPKLRKEDNDMVRNWNKKLGKNVWTWTYVNKYAATNIPGIPLSTPKAVGRYYKEIASDIFGSIMESETDFYIFQFLNRYIFAKVAWNNKIDTDKELSDTYKAMFGPVAGDMQKFFEMIEELWLTGIVGTPLDTPAGPTFLAPSAYQLWRDVYNDKNMAELNGFLQKAEKAAKHDKLALKRVNFFRKTFYDAILVEKNKFEDVQYALENWQIENRTLGDKETVVIDGKLKDNAWKGVKPTFLTVLEKGKAPVKTTVKARYDENNLYLAFECEESEMDKLLSSQKPRDDKFIWQDSCVEIFLNPSGDRKNYYQFIINADGVIGDLKCKRTGAKNECDWKWNSSAIAKSMKMDDRWNVEIAIPLKEVGADGKKRFPVNFTRSRSLIGKKVADKYYSWSPFIKGFHDIINFGYMSFDKVADKNLLINGDFSEPASGRRYGRWFKNAGDKAVALDYKVYLSGGQSMRLRNDEQKKTLIIQELPGKIEPGKTYRLSFMVKTENLKPTKKYDGVFTHFNDGVNHPFPRVPIRSDMPWTHYSFSFKAGPNAGKKKSCFLRLFSTIKGTAWFDNVRLEVVD